MQVPLLSKQNAATARTSSSGTIECEKHDDTQALCLYVLLVRPHFEYVVSVWNPLMWKYIDTLESVQHRASRLVPCLRKEPDEYKLQITKLDIKRSYKLYILQSD